MTQDLLRNFPRAQVRLSKHLFPQTYFANNLMTEYRWNAKPK